MRIDAHKLAVDESKSNPIAVALGYSYCPMPEKRPCFYLAVGSGTSMEICMYFKQIPDNENEADCTYGLE